VNAVAGGVLVAPYHLVIFNGLRAAPYDQVAHAIIVTLMCSLAFQIGHFRLAPAAICS
jgi:hypothetical protein